MTKKTVLFNEHVKLNARIIDFGGWMMPVQYSSIIEEHNTTRNSAGLFDICHMGEIFIEGKQAFELLQKTVSKDLTNMPGKKVHLAVLTNENGGLLDDLTVYKFSNEKFMLVVNSSNNAKDFEWIKQAQQKFNFDANVIDKTDSYAKIDLQGPKAQQILSKATNFDLNKIKFYSFEETKIFDIDTIVSRSGYTGEDGFELYFDSSKANEVWNKLLEVGKEFGLTPAGLGARDSLRLEAGMNLYGNEMNEKTTPLEVRYSWVTSLDKDFIGAEALRKQKKEGVKRKLIGLEMIDNSIARHDYKVFKEGKEVGKITSGVPSPTLGKKIAMALIEKDAGKINDELDVEVRGKLFRAKIVKLPFYKRK